MALESIGATGSRNYVDVVKTVNKTPQTQAVKATEEPVKKQNSAPMAAVTATVSADAKGAEAAQKKEEDTVSSKIKDAVDKVNQKIVPSKTRCEFSYHRSMASPRKISVSSSFKKFLICSHKS